jgi:hypothetical protein
MKKCFSLIVRSCAFGACLLATSFAATAAVINLNIDPTQSSLSLTGGAFGLAFNPQTAGATTTSLSGTITADLTGGVFTFSGGSGIVFDVNPNGPFTTAPNPLGVVAGNYGVTASGVVPSVGQSTVNGVYRNLTLDVLGGSAQNGLAMSGGVLKFTGGVLDFGAATPLGDATGTSDIIAQANNTAGGLVTWDGTTLTFPILFVTQGGSGRVENWSGVVVARVPEPSSLALVSVLGLTALVRKRRTLA